LDSVGEVESRDIAALDGSVTPANEGALWCETRVLNRFKVQDGQRVVGTLIVSSSRRFRSINGSRIALSL
jgi:hypothetical protein